MVNMRRFQPLAALLADWPQPDVVLLSHNHDDHFEEHTQRALAQTPAHFIVPLGLGAYLKPLGVADITELGWWQHAQRGDLRITLVPPFQTSGRSLSDGARSFWGGFLLQHGGETIYYSAIRPTARTLPKSADAFRTLASPSSRTASTTAAGPATTCSPNKPRKPPPTSSRVA